MQGAQAEEPHHEPEQDYGGHAIEHALLPFGGFEGLRCRLRHERIVLDAERPRQSWNGLTSLRTIMRDDGAMKRATAISRLSDVADGLERSKELTGSCVIAGYVFGSLLDPAGDIERVQLALVVDEPVAAVPWMSRPRHLEALASLLRFDKLPLEWRWRPSAWPVWNHEITRAVCFWSATAGSDQGTFAALTAGRVEKLEFVEPADSEQLIEALRLERDAGRRHLAQIVDGFYDRDWRREHTGDGVYPADHLWWATSAYLDLDNAANDAFR